MGRLRHENGDHGVDPHELESNPRGRSGFARALFNGDIPKSAQRRCLRGIRRARLRVSGAGRPGLAAAGHGWSGYLGYASIVARAGNRSVLRSAMFLTRVLIAFFNFFLSALISV